MKLKTLHNDIRERSAHIFAPCRQLLMIMLIFVIGISDLRAQEVVLQVILPNAANQPRTLDAWNADPTVVQIIVTNLSSNDLFDLRFSFNIRGSKQGAIVQSDDLNPSQRRFDLAGNEVRVFLWDDLVASATLDVAEGIESKFLRDGLPEDNYQVCASILDLNDTAINFGRSTCGSFLAYDPDPPTLTFPLNGIEVNPNAFQLMWTPVQRIGVNYRLVITPIFENQTKENAIENNPLQQLADLSTPGYFYLPSDPPFDTFELATGYAWQVQSLIFNEPYGRNNGYSQVGYFKVKELEDPLEYFEDLDDNSDESGVIAMERSNTEWNIPSFDPVLNFKFDDQGEIDQGIEIDGPISEVTIRGKSSSALFDQARIRNGELLSGSAILNDGLSFRIPINQGGRLGLIQMAAADNSQPGESELLIDYPSSVRLTTSGIEPLGGALAKINFGDLDSSPLSAEFSNDFLISLSPLMITQGRITFISGGQLVGHVDQLGYHDATPIIIIGGEQLEHVSASELLSLELTAQSISEDALVQLHTFDVYENLGTASGLISRKALSSDDPRPDGISANPPIQIVVQEAASSDSTAFVKGNEIKVNDGFEYSRPIVRSFKKVGSSWKIDSWIEPAENDAALESIEQREITPRFVADPITELLDEGLLDLTPIPENLSDDSILQFGIFKKIEPPTDRQSLERRRKVIQEAVRKSTSTSALGSDDPRPDGLNKLAPSDDPRPNGAVQSMGVDYPRPDGAQKTSDDPRPDGVSNAGSDDPRPGLLDGSTSLDSDLLILDAAISSTSAFVRGSETNSQSGVGQRKSFVRTYKKVEGVWKISSWIELE